MRDYFLTHAAPEALRTAYAELKALEQGERGVREGASRPRW